MRIEDYPRNIELLVNQHLGNYIHAGSKALLIERARLFGRFFEKRRRNRPVIWKFSIPREHPLIFNVSSVDSCRLQVDVSCEIEGRDDKINKQNILVRVWCLEQRISFRRSIDAIELEDILKSLDWRRVVFRLHFDLRALDTKIPEPLYHLHIGGDPLSEENSWFPKQIKVPRFPYPPMDLILLSEFVLMNFFQEQSEQLRKKPEWESLVRKSQYYFQREYFNRCMKHIDSKTCTLLGNLASFEQGN